MHDQVTSLCNQSSCKLPRGVENLGSKTCWNVNTFHYSLLMIKMQWEKWML